MSNITWQLLVNPDEKEENKHSLIVNVTCQIKNMFFQGILLETDGQNQYKQYQETKMIVTQPYCTHTDHGTQHMNT